MTDIKLYGYSTSPFVRKVGCCLMYKQIPFEFVPVNPTHPKQISFTRQTQVPVLQIDGEWRNAWPEVLQMAPFIKHMMCDIDRTESVRDMQIRVAMELLQHLNGGPYFGGLDKPSLVDFAIFPQLVFNYMVGIEQDLTAAREPSLGLWLDHMQAHLPGNPVLVPDFMVVNRLPAPQHMQDQPQQIASA